MKWEYFNGKIDEHNNRWKMTQEEKLININRRWEPAKRLVFVVLWGEDLVVRDICTIFVAKLAVYD